MSEKVYWVSRHQLSPAQWRALRDIHGKDVVVVWEAVVFDEGSTLVDYIQHHRDGFVYAVASSDYVIDAALAGEPFGHFKNHPAKRQDGTFGLCAVFHVVGREQIMRWRNEDPLSDEGERLVPIPRNYE